MHIQKTLTNFSIWVALIIASFILSILIGFSDPAEQLKLSLTDQLFELRGPITFQDTSVVIVSVSQQADQEIPFKYPWPVNLHAKLVENLNKAGARAVGFDIIFDQRDNYDLRHDTTFAQSLSDFNNVVLGGSIQYQNQNRGAGSNSSFVSFIKPNPVLQSKNTNPLGLVRTYKDDDASIRKYLLSVNHNGNQYLSLGLELLRLFEDVTPDEIKDLDNYFQLGTYNIPKWGDNLMAINYYGEPGTFPRYSYDSVIDDSTIILQSEDPDFQINSFSDPDFGLKSSDVFQDKIVLVGATMPELNDLHSTPFATKGGMPGVEVHANAIQTILDDNYVRTLPTTASLLLLGTLILAIIFAVRKLSGLWGLSFYLLLCLTIGIIVAGAFLYHQLILDLVAMVTALSVGYIITQSYEYVTEQQEKKRIRNMFSSYVSPALVEEMISSGQQPQLGGDEIYMTAFFSDIQSFSSFSEQISAPQLVKLINEYLTEMTAVVTDHGGTLDKYIGDAIVAFFGAPVPQKDHAYKACVVSQLMQERLALLRDKWRKEGNGWPKIVHHMQTRIGINTGLMVTGNMGSRQRFNYTMMGDNVNLAARCESGAKHYGVYTMVTEATKKEAQKYGNRCIFRYLDCTIVKGRTQPVNVYEIMGLRDHISPDQWQCKQLFERGIEAYQNQQWAEAMKLFQNAKEFETLSPDKHQFIHTNPSLVYLQRCRQQKERSSEEQWDGIHKMDSK